MARLCYSELRSGLASGRLDLLSWSARRWHGGCRSARLGGCWSLEGLRLNEGLACGCSRFISPERGPNGERFHVVSAPPFAVCKVEPGYRPRTILARNSSGKFHEFHHVEAGGDKADELALLPLIVGVAR